LEFVGEVGVVVERLEKSCSAAGVGQNALVLYLKNGGRAQIHKYSSVKKIGVIMK
jgi:hypothetical protein